MSKWKVKEEVAKFPDRGSIKKNGRKTQFYFEITTPAEEFENMQDAKKAFNKHYNRLQKIIDKYFYFYIRARMYGYSKHNKLKHGMVEEMLKKVGFIDED